ncbi:MAG: glycosyltransferase family 4 protein [Candidatus Limnocylindria bacterium]
MTHGATHVVMLVRNPFTHDSRVEKEAASLREAGYRVTVVADRAPGLPPSESKDGIMVRRLARSKRHLPGISFAMHERRIAQSLIALRPDVLHAHDSNALVPVGIAAARVGRPFIYDAHDLWLHRPRRQRTQLYHEAQNAYYRLVERTFVPRAAATFAVSPPIVRHLARRYALASVGLVPNYPDHRGVVGRRQLRDLRELRDIPPGRPLILYLGGLMGGRGIEHAVRAMPRVPGAHLVLLGSGHQASELADEARRAEVSDRVHIVDPVMPDEVVAYAASATVGISPIVPSCLNYRYSLPNKLFQYMEAGIPVIASDFSQVRDVVIGSGAGIVVDTESPKAIAGGIAQLLADPEAAEAMGRRGHAAVAEQYNWSVSEQVLLAAYARVLQDGRSGGG